jgi:thiamine kinase-like enzyme
MEINKIEELIEKYLEGNTSLQEENVLKTFFLSQNIPSHLNQYKAVFSYYSQSKKETTKEIILPKKHKSIKWIRIAASVFLVTMIASYLYQNTTKKEDLGTFDTPEEAFVETHKALQLVASNINSGMKNASYIEEYEKTKKIIFK